MPHQKRTSHALIDDAAAFGLPQVPFGNEIPPILHQTFATKDLPPELAQNVAHLKASNPRWEHRFYDDSDIEAFIANNYGFKVLESYERIRPEYGPARADLFRYLVIYLCGGIYLDIKAGFVRPIDDVLRSNDRYVLSHWGRAKGERHEWHPELRHIPGGDEFQQWHIIAAPGHPFLRAVIEAVLANIDGYSFARHGTGKPAVLRLTGPIPYTLAIHPLLPLYPHRIVPTEAEIGLRYSILKTKHSHETLLGRHYSTLTTPVVRSATPKTTLPLPRAFAANGERTSPNEMPKL